MVIWLVLQEELATKEELKDLDKQLRRDVEDEISKAREAEQPGDEELFANIYKADSGLIAYGCDRKITKIQMPWALDCELSIKMCRNCRGVREVSSLTWSEVCIAVHLLF